MKEKTFEELVKEHEWYDRADYAKKEPFLDKADVLKLLHQVREATIAECTILYVPDGNPESWLNKINALPTNSIKTDL